MLCIFTFDIFKTFIYKLHDICLNNPCDNIIVLGDFNVPDFSLYSQEENVSCYEFINPADKPKCDLLLNTLNLCNLHQYSTIKNYINRTLDLVLSNTSVEVDKCDSPLINIDKHHPALTIDFNFSIDHNLNKISESTVYRDFKIANYIEIREKLRNYNWNVLYNIPDVDKCVDVLYSVLNELIAQFVPVIKKKNRNFPIWYASSTIAIYNEKKLYHKRWKK